MPTIGAISATQDVLRRGSLDDNARSASAWFSPAIPSSGLSTMDINIYFLPRLAEHVLYNGTVWMHTD
jgi:hypothetical protein